MSSLLKNTKKEASIVNAREMVIISYPKIGKTELLTKLPGNYLILDFEGGTDFYSSNAINVNDLDTFNQLRDEFIATSPKFDFIVIDTLTSLYNNIVNQIAVSMYNKDEKKSKPLDWDITVLGYGLGYTYKRNALQKIQEFFRQYCNCLILSAHVADKAMGNTDEQMNVKDIDIEGKLKNILALKTDAIGILSRTAPNQNTLSFTASTGQVAGTRVKHLANKEILISEKMPDGELKTHWDQVFIKSN